MWIRKSGALYHGSGRKGATRSDASVVSRTSAATEATTTSLPSIDDEAHIKRVADLRLSEGSFGLEPGHLTSTTLDYAAAEYYSSISQFPY